MTRTTAKYLAFLALSVILFHWKTMLTNQFTTIVGSEGVNQTYAWLHFWVNSLWHGHIPMWDPYTFGGRPFAGETQTTAFYPFRLLFALVPLNRQGLVSPRFYHEYLVFNRFLGACFMFALMRELKRSHFAAFVAACAFSMGGMLGRLPWPQLMESCIWLPATLFFLLRALRAESTRRFLPEAALSGFCIGLSILTGGVQFSLMQSIVVVTAVCYYGAVTRPFQWPRLALIVATVFVFAAGTGAVQFLPSFEYARYSLRFIAGGAFPMSQKIPYDRMDHGMWPQSIVTGLFPVIGPAMGGGESWPYYIGVFPLFLAVTAIWRCWTNLWVRYLTILAVLAFAYALGELSPLNGILYAVVPELWQNREPSRFFYLVSFALAVLSAFGLDSLLDGAGNRALWAPARPFLKWIAIVCGAALVLPGLINQITFNIWVSFSLLLIIASCGWFYRLTLGPAPSSFRFLLVAFILFDLGAFYWHEASWSEAAKLGDKYQQMLTLRQPVAFIKAQPGLFRIRVAADPEPNVGDYYAVQSLWGGGATIMTDYSRFMVREDLLNVRYRIRPAATPDPGAIYHDSFWKVYEDKAGYPRAWLTHQAIVEPSHDAVFTRIGKAGSDFHDVAIVESPLPRNLDPNATGDSIRFRSYEADSMSMDVNTAGTALLVVSEVFYPGWKATVNGQPAEIHKTDGALRGILVAGGFSHVVMKYVPVSIYAGAVLSILTVGGVLVWCVLLWRRSYTPAR
jgi:hypothetical protein